MKKLISISLFIIACTYLFAQVPQALNYQAVARTAAGAPIANGNVGVKLSVLNGSPTGTVEYAETHTATTNSLGLFTLSIGQGTPQSGTFGAINWTSGAKYLKTEIDPAGGTAYTLSGTSPMQSVPYALYADKVNLTAGAGIGIAGNTITNTGDVSNTNELQTLSLAGNTLSISNGNSVTLPTGGGSYTAGAGISIAGNVISNTGDADSNPTNEIQTLTLAGSTLSITGGNSVTLPTGGGTNYWTANGANIYNNNTGNVGVKINAPVSPLHVASTTYGTNDAILTSAYTGTASYDAIGVLGNSKPLDYYGIGGVFSGGYLGAAGLIQDALSEDYTGLLGQVGAIANGTGIYVGTAGNADGANGLAVGGNFVANGNVAGIGVVGEVSLLQNTTIASINDLGNPGGYFTGDKGRGMFGNASGTMTLGTATIAVGGQGLANSTGMYNVGLMGYGLDGSTSSTGAEFYGEDLTTNSQYIQGVYAEAVSTGSAGTWAGYFTGDVTVVGNLAKSGGTFQIDHPLDPENKYLYHSFVESPDMMNIYNGNVTTDANGLAIVTLPTYFEALNQDFRYQLTPIGTFAQAIVKEEVQGNQFMVQTDKPNVKISWQVTGVRKDAWAAQNRVVPEVEKPAIEKGKYLHPELYGADRSKGISSLHSSKGSSVTTQAPNLMHAPKLSKKEVLNRK